MDFALFLALVLLLSGILLAMFAGISLLKLAEFLLSRRSPFGTCRICGRKDRQCRLTIPCKCTGGIAYVHAKCFIKNSKNKEQEACGDCKSAYSTLSSMDIVNIALLASMDVFCIGGLILMGLHYGSVW